MRRIPVLVLAVLASLTATGTALAIHRESSLRPLSVKRALPALHIQRLGGHRIAVTTTRPTWNNDYPWLADAGQGYIGIHHDTTDPDGAWGFATNLGGNPGLWLYPIGAQRYSGEAEFTYTAPGTTRLLSASLDIAYPNKMLAHHCLNIGLRTDADVVDQNTRCNPADVRQVDDPNHVELADPNANPASKQFFFQLAIPPCQAGPCDSQIPALDPLKNGGYARLKSLRMVLVDDDNPVVSTAGELTDQVYINGTRSYGLTINSFDPGAGISQAWAELGDGTRIASADAPCDPAHNTEALDNRICPSTFGFDTTVDTNPFPEGRNDIVGKAVDPAGNVGTSDAFTVLVDRTGPSAPSSIELWSYDPGTQTATIGWDAGTDPDLPTGEPGSGVSRGEYRYRVNGGGWSDGTPTDSPDSDTFTPAFDVAQVAVGDQIDVEARQWDDVGNASDVGSAHLVVTGDEHFDDFGAVQDDGTPPEGTPDNGLRDPSLPSQPYKVMDDFIVDDGSQPATPVFLSALHTESVSAGPRSVLFRSDTAADPCTGKPTHGANGAVSWDVYSKCIVFTNNGGDAWTIYKTCSNNPGGDQRQDVGPGYIARLDDADGNVLVDDFRLRTRDHDAAIYNLGNIGATNGGLGTFEVQYARGTSGSLHAGAADYAVDPVKNFGGRAGHWPPDGFISDRACAGLYGNYGVARYRFTGPWKVGPSLEGFRAEVWLRDPDTDATPTDSSALLKVTYLYRFTASRVLALNILRVNPDQPSARGHEFAKEPKWGASVRADGLFNELDVIDSNGNVAALQHGNPGAVRGQREQPGGVLYTTQASKDDRVRVRWSCTDPVCGDGAAHSNPCPRVCFNVDMRSLDPATLQLKNPFANSAAHLWASNVTHPRGLDGWAIRADARPTAYANDTTGDNFISTCSAVNLKGAQIPGAGYEAPFEGQDVKALRAVSLTSSLAHTRQWTARRWELAGWKNGIAPMKPGDPTPDWIKYAFDGSAVLFNGWEGARGPYDCEPLLAEFPTTAQTYVNRAEYWVQH